MRLLFILLSLCLDFCDASLWGLPSVLLLGLCTAQAWVYQALRAGHHLLPICPVMVVTSHLSALRDGATSLLCALLHQQLLHFTWPLAHPAPTPVLGTSCFLQPLCPLVPW